MQASSSQDRAQEHCAESSAPSSNLEVDWCEQEIWHDGSIAASAFMVWSGGSTRDSGQYISDLSPMRASSDTFMSSGDASTWNAGRKRLNCSSTELHITHLGQEAASVAERKQRQEARPFSGGAIGASLSHKGCGKGDPARWWTQERAICPLSGFPIAMLPYPPYKLACARGEAGNLGAREKSQHVDGVYLMLTVIRDWKFEVLDAPLTLADIRSLDTYMKKCKLGNFRLGYAMELLSRATSEAQKELEDMRERARHRLEDLMKIQKARIESRDYKPTQSAKSKAKQKKRR
jgi:hypothetical protein